MHQLKHLIGAIEHLRQVHEFLVGVVVSQRIAHLAQTAHLNRDAMVFVQPGLQGGEMILGRCGIA